MPCFPMEENYVFNYNMPSQFLDEQYLIYKFEFDLIDLIAVHKAKIENPPNFNSTAILLLLARTEKFSFCVLNYTMICGFLL